MKDMRKGMISCTKLVLLGARQMLSLCKDIQSINVKDMDMGEAAEGRAMYDLKWKQVVAVQLSDTINKFLGTQFELFMESSL